MPSVQRPTNVFRDMDTIRQLVASNQPVVFLDYDGALSPIVDIPDRAFMADAMRAQRALVQVHHGDRHGPLDRESAQLGARWQPRVRHQRPQVTADQLSSGRPLSSALEQCVRDLMDKLAGIPGAEIEDNRLAGFVLYRHVTPALQSVGEGIVDDYVACQPSLVNKHEKKVFELCPQVDWNKGRAVLYILSQLGLDADSIVPFYLGDDVSDEDAFSALNARGDGKGVSIIVRDPEASKVDLPDDSMELPATTAVYSLRDTLEVEQFLTTPATLEEVVSFDMRRRRPRLPIALVRVAAPVALRLLFVRK